MWFCLLSIAISTKNVDDLSKLVSICREKFFFHSLERASFLRYDKSFGNKLVCYFHLFTFCNKNMLTYSSPYLDYSFPVKPYHSS